ncbi:uncharacterized protein A1O9_04044 [Exophiala aquamarina CBS 119918]|uniref:Carboxylic ester hydrolase n=1 Tax=Exophiala aquamarina CBS 119918 TaxID=1182545 RepID=A0A072PUJ9_9EURO|nr:uncharacterized protein A1O9_04044 [Exophiala aquamarina CBS 119918]KEF59200.1 hypothetical protein A1O9_04044 [Exophiala aquamarina CBS 119918]
MILPTRAIAAARCIPEIFTNAGLFGVQTVSISTNVVTNWTVDAPPGTVGSDPSGHTAGIDFCNVSVATSHPGWGDQINTEVWLPLENWNHRLQMSGGGGLVTGLLIPQMNMALSDYYAVVSTDGGHYQDDPSTWALAGPGNVNLYNLLDFSSLALYEAAIIGKSVVNDFYSAPPEFSYFVGCSTGGRQGLMFAQRYPDVFDGILAAAPALRFNFAIITGFYPLIMLLEEGIFPRQCELDALVQMAVRQCDPLDGVTDGIISAPELCEFDPYAFLGTPVPCGNTEVNLTYAAVLGVLTTWNPALGFPTEFWPGLGTGSPVFGLLNTTCQSVLGECDGVPFAPLEQWAQYFLKKDPRYDWHSLTVEELYSFLSSPENKLYESFIATNDPDLSGFRDAGGKMITWHGLADQYIPPNISRAYYDSVTELDSNVVDFYRYFQAPGVNHCGGGNGPYPLGLGLASLVAWVENGTPPDVLQAVSPPGPEGFEYQRPICKYPYRAEYKGQGNLTQSENWECR